jgi:hypothetical protein
MESATLISLEFHGHGGRIPPLLVFSNNVLSEMKDWKPPAYWMKNPVTLPSFMLSVASASSPPSLKVSFHSVTL